jgi:hypothetical protein
VIFFLIFFAALAFHISTLCHLNTFFFMDTMEFCIHSGKPDPKIEAAGPEGRTGESAFQDGS